jgi:hypothetical protein
VRDLTLLKTALQAPKYKSFIDTGNIGGLEIEINNPVPEIQVSRLIPEGELLSFLVSTGLLNRTATESRLRGSDEARSALIALDIILRNPNVQFVDAQSPEIQGLMQLLQSEGFLTAAEVAQFNSLGVRNGSLIESLYGTDQYMNHLEIAEALR